MKKQKKSLLDCESIWKTRPKSVTAMNDLELILGSVKSLPISNWKANFLFITAKDKDLFEITGGRFPAKLEPGKTHPVFSLRQIKDTASFTSCPCSTRKPFFSKKYRYIKKNTKLKYTGRVTNKDSYLIEAIRLNIPAPIAAKLMFFGEVPEEALITENSKGKKNDSRE